MPEYQQIQQSKKTDTTSQKQATVVSQTPVSNPYSIIQRAKINPKSLTYADIMQLQRTIGNRAVGRLLTGIGSSTTAQQATVQRQEIPEEEKTCPSCMQRQEILDGEEPPLQGKFAEPIQCQKIPEQEGEEPLQGKIAKTIQRQEIPEEEEPLQGRFKEPIQRQEIPEEEEPLQGKMTGTIQRQEIPEEEPLQTKRENNTGMPDNLKAGVESFSGIDMSDVRVHYNSDKPAEVRALAYTQGTDIHVAPGQEKHLPHEAWHVVQQAQGRVKPTMQLKGEAVNDDVGLEREADEMGNIVNNYDAKNNSKCVSANSSGEGILEKFNFIGSNKSVVQYTGLDKSACINRIIPKMVGIQNEWENLSIDHRLGLIGEAINTELIKVNSYPCIFNALPLPLDNYSFFNPANWEISLKIEFLMQSIGSVNSFAEKEKMGNLLNSVYHEARHSEQVFLVARYLAASHKPVYILNSLGIPERVALEASKHPLGPFKTKKVDKAKSWETDLRIDAFSDRTYLEAIAGGGYIPLELYSKYRSLPIEVDANKVGDKAENMYRQFIPSDRAQRILRDLIRKKLRNPRELPVGRIFYPFPLLQSHFGSSDWQYSDISTQTDSDREGSTQEAAPHASLHGVPQPLTQIIPQLTQIAPQPPTQIDPELADYY